MLSLFRTHETGAKRRVVIFFGHGMSPAGSTLQWVAGEIMAIPKVFKVSGGKGDLQRNIVSIA